MMKKIAFILPKEFPVPAVNVVVNPQAMPVCEDER